MNGLIASARQLFLDYLGLPVTRSSFSHSLSSMLSPPPLNVHIPLLTSPQDVLPALHELAAAQDRMSLGPAFSAADLINALHLGSRSGLPAVRQTMGRLLWHCNQVLMQQLAAW